MSEKKTIFLLRHGKTEYPNCYIGSRDVSLSTEGKMQIAGLQGDIQALGVDHIISSPMQRCRQTCEILFPGREFEYDADLREIDFGSWEGLTFAEIVKTDPVLVDQWAEWSLDFCFPEGESIGCFVDRVKKVGNRISQLHEKKILLVCHGGVARALLCHYLGLGPENYLLFQLEKGKFSSMDLYDGLGVLTGLNLG